jgi:hypothetical protein
LHLYEWRWLLWLVRKEEKGLLDLWILLVFKAADGRIHFDKMMMVAYLLEKAYGLVGVSSRQNNALERRGGSFVEEVGVV